MSPYHAMSDGMVECANRSTKDQLAKYLYTKVAGAQQKLYFDHQMRHTAYEPGDLVWVDCPALARHRLSPKWTGPYKVCGMRQLDSPNGDIRVDYELQNQLDLRAKPKVIHYNRLKPYCSLWSKQNWRVD
ncbi:hypothetical protein MHYP_G00025450 [Metynnis hypsauchen]